MNSSTTPIRVGLIVPSSNVTIETELPALLARHESATFTFHSSRMRMQEVSEVCRQTWADKRYEVCRRKQSTTVAFMVLVRRAMNYTIQG